MFTRTPKPLIRSLLCSLVGLLLPPFPAFANHSSKQSAPAASAPALPRPPDDGYPRDAGSLFRALATIRGLQAKFEERKTLALLRAPLVSSGVLYYHHGGYLLRHVQQPTESHARITPTALELRTAQQSQRIDLRQRPDLKLFVESLTRVLAGDRAALERAYTVIFLAPKQLEASWQLKLTPKQAPLNQLVRSLVFTGRGYAIEQLVVEEANGDRTLTTFRDVNAQRRYSPQELERLFGIKPQQP